MAPDHPNSLACHIHIYLHHTIIICVIQTSQKIYNRLTSIHYELTHNLYIYYRTSNYTEMKIYLNDHHTSEYLQMVLCMYNTDHMYYSPEEKSAYIYVGFSLNNLYHSS